MNYFYRRTILFVLASFLLSVDSVPVSAADISTIFFRLYVGSTVAEYVDEKLANANSLLPKMQSDRMTIFYLHGFTESLESESVRTVISAYLQLNNHNVLGIDYREIASQNYAQVATNTKEVGVAVADALNEMTKKGLDLKKVHIIGHSMGAQVAGQIGRNLGSELLRITGLDPAGPFFNFIEDHLSSADAGFVDIIHTDYGAYGIGRTTGHADFFPNGGHRVQPGCPAIAVFFSTEEFCSHYRSWQVYAESVTDERAFLAVKCPSQFQFTFGECSKNDVVPMGYATPIGTEGTYYLTTNAESPYGRKEQGTRGTREHT